MSGQQDATANKRLQELIEGSAEIAGGAIGGALGFLAGGLPGAALLGAGGAAAAQVLQRLGQEVGQRLLGPREEVRVGGVLAITAAEINRRLASGHHIRSDGFFEQGSRGRSDAEEVAESVLLKSQREPEEKKTPYLAYLLANIAFDPQISAQLGHQLTKAAEQLTYRQLCILKLAVVKEQFGLRQEDYRGQGRFAQKLLQVLYECYDLTQRGFIGLGGEVAFGPADIAPNKMTVQGVGADLYNLMLLVRIPDEDLRPIVKQLL